MNAKAQMILAAVRSAMQPAEEADGPEGQEYVELMRAIARDATGRANDYEAWLHAEHDAAQGKWRFSVDGEASSSLDEFREANSESPDLEEWCAAMRRLAVGSRLIINNGAGGITTIKRVQ